MITSAIWYGVGFFIFWRRSDDWLALLAAFVLIMFNITSLSNNNAPKTMQPTQVSLWLRPLEHDGKQRAPWRANPPVSSEGK